MNCHMPRINEGLQDVVRSHTIFSPTNAEMIAANDLNACNLCHTKKPIGWTLRYLREWFDVEFKEELIARRYPNRIQSVALGWLNSNREQIRLVAADALTRTNSQWALPELLDALDDEFVRVKASAATSRGR